METGLCTDVMETGLCKDVMETGLCKDVMEGWSKRSMGIDRKNRIIFWSLQLIWDQFRQQMSCNIMSRTILASLKSTTFKSDTVLYLWLWQFSLIVLDTQLFSLSSNVKSAKMPRLSLTKSVLLSRQTLFCCSRNVFFFFAVQLSRGVHRVGEVAGKSAG